MENKEYSNLSQYCHAIVRRNSDGINEQSIENQMEILIMRNNRITARELSDLLGITLRNVEKRMDAMKKAGRLIRKGARKNGYWQSVGE